MMTRREMTLGSAALLAGCASTPLPVVPTGLAAGEQRAWTLGEERLWLWLPPEYAQRREPWPLLVFLHGSGERGTDLDKVKVHGPPMLAAAGTRYPLILASPQLEENGDWNPDRLHRLLGELKARLNVDPRRCLATGLSRGGHGVWNWASAYPQDLAAIAPVCGYGDPAKVPAMRGVPVRAYHGDADNVVPLERQQACIDALRAAGGQASFTIYPGVNHGSWIPAYQDPELLPWLLAQHQS